MAMAAKKKAFTLVELLVVIGIIALLIGILLPALNKARQQANLIDCEARLRQIGSVLQIYETENNGSIPLGQIDRTVVPGSDNQEPYWYWMFTLGGILNPDMMGSDGAVHNLSKIFTDVDTAPGDGVYVSSATTGYWTSHYACNPRLFYYPGMISFYGPGGLPEDTFKTILIYNRKVTNVALPSNVFAVWDAPQIIDRGYNAYPVSQAIDGFGFYNNGLAYDAGPLYPAISPSLAVWPNSVSGTSGVGDGRAAQKQLNFDVSDLTAPAPNIPWNSLRFRHVNNTKLAALCLDGHVETRLVGEVTRNDIYTNHP
jgi:prepilin-type N-terminal cleavage/methylation domain-containing protein